MGQDIGSTVVLPIYVVDTIIVRHLEVIFISYPIILPYGYGVVVVVIPIPFYIWEEERSIAHSIA